MAFLKALLTNKDNTDQLLIDTYKLTNPKLFTESRLPVVNNILVPELDLFIAMLSDKQDDFNMYQEKALIKHKTFYGEDTKSITGLISFSLSAICALAYEHGIKIEVESDYIPRFLIEGKF